MGRKKSAKNLSTSKLKRYNVDVSVVRPCMRQLNSWIKELKRSVAVGSWLRSQVHRKKKHYLL